MPESHGGGGLANNVSTEDSNAHIEQSHDDSADNVARAEERGDEGTAGRDCCGTGDYHCDEYPEVIDGYHELELRPVEGLGQHGVAVHIDAGVAESGLPGVLKTHGEEPAAGYCVDEEVYPALDACAKEIVHRVGAGDHNGADKRAEEYRADGEACFYCRPKGFLFHVLLPLLFYYNICAFAIHPTPRILPLLRLRGLWALNIFISARRAARLPR